MKSKEDTEEDVIITRIEDAIKKGDYQRALINLGFLKDSLNKYSTYENIRDFESRVYLLALESTIKEVEDCIRENKCYSAISLLGKAEMYLYELVKAGLEDIDNYSRMIDILRVYGYKLCIEHELSIANEVLKRGDYNSVRAILSRIEEYISKIPRPTTSWLPNDIKDFKRKIRSEIEKIRKEMKRMR